MKTERSPALERSVSIFIDSRGYRRSCLPLASHRWVLAMRARSSAMITKRFFSLLGTVWRRGAPYARERRPQSEVSSVWVKFILRLPRFTRNALVAFKVRQGRAR